MAWYSTIVKYHIPIDGAGRVVIPKPVRELMHLSKGTTLELSLDGDRLVLSVPKAQGGGLAIEDGMLIVGGELPGVPLSVEDVRQTRIANLIGL